jgi:hypothetical protein
MATFLARAIWEQNEEERMSAEGRRSNWSDRQARRYAVDPPLCH